MAHRICAPRWRKASRSSKACAVTRPATQCRNSSSTRPAAAARYRLIPATSSITTTKKSLFAITKAKSSSIPKPETKTCSSPRSASITTNICTRRQVSRSEEQEAYGQREGVSHHVVQTWHYCKCACVPSNRFDCRFFEHNLAADHCHLSMRLENFRVGNFHD